MIKFIDLQSQYQRHKTAIDQRIQNVLDHSQYICGPEVVELEQRLADFIGVKHCVVVDSGTVALQVAMMSLGIAPGDEVITSPFSFFASASTILQLGAIPVFVDIDPRTYNLDPQLIVGAITAKTKLIMPVSLYGQCADFDKINAIAAEYGLAVIEDAAQSFGARYKGRYSCSLTDIACTSFFPSKPLGCYGDGGACFTDDDNLAELIRAIANHGQTGRYHHEMLGINGRCDSIQAAVLLAKLDFFPEEIALRQQVAAIYQQRLAGKIQLPFIESFNQSAYAQYTVAVLQREQVQHSLDQYGIPTAVHYPQPIYQQPAWQTVDSNRFYKLPHVERAAQQVLSLPFDPYLGETDINTVCDILLSTIENFDLVSC